MKTKSFAFQYFIAISLSCLITFLCLHSLTSLVAHICLITLTTTVYGCIQLVKPTVFSLFAPSYLTWMSTLLLFRPSHFSTTGWNFMPIVYSIALLKHLTISQIIWYFGGNILLFIPVGFIIANFTISLRRTLLAGFFIMLSVELIQGITGCGVFDIDDLILNLSGIGLGFLCWYAFEKIGQNQTEYVKQKY